MTKKLGPLPALTGWTRGYCMRQQVHSVVSDRWVDGNQFLYLTLKAVGADGRAYSMFWYIEFDKVYIDVPKIVLHFKETILAGGLHG